MTAPGIASEGAPTIETERLVLRAFAESDLDDYFEILDTPEVRASLRLSVDFDVFGAWDQLAAFTGQWALRGTGQWAVIEKQSGALVGRAGTHHPHRFDWPGVEVGWALHPNHWGRGFATEAGRAAVDWAFGNLDLDVLHSMIRPSNVASAAVAQRLGFVARETRRFAWFPNEDHTRWELESGQPNG